MRSVRENWPNWKGCIHSDGYLFLEGNIQPKIVSPTYAVSIRFKPGLNPTVKVIRPELKLYPGKRSLPHVFKNNDTSLCLFFGYEFDNRSDLLSESIIVWITWWLCFYEIWAETGKWVAKGTHPGLW